MDILPPSLELCVLAGWLPSIFSNFSFLRGKIVVCCSNALPHARKPPWPSVPASPVRQPASAQRNAAPTSFVDDLTNSSPMNEGNFPVRKASRTRKTRKDFRYGRASFASLVARRPAPARKWRRNGLKRLNPRPRMVWSRKPRSHNIWYTGARLTVRSGEIVSDPRLWPGGHSSRIRSAGRPMENFPRNRGKSRGSVGDVSRVSLVICARLGVSSQPGTTRARLDRARNGVGSWREV